MSLTRLHPFFRNLPYTARTPDIASFSGSQGLAYYAGFVSTDNGCCISYQPIWVLISPYCCNNEAHLFVQIWSKTSTKKLTSKSECACWKYNSALQRLELISEFCDGDAFIIDNIALADYQQRLTTAFSTANSEEGFSLAQTLFWDLPQDLLCPCEEKPCPSGMEWSQEQCACVPVEECLDERVVKARISLSVPVNLVRLNIVKRDSKGRITSSTQISLGVSLSIEVVTIELYRYRAKGNLLTQFLSDLSEEIAEIAIEGALEAALITIAGEAGMILSEFISVDVFTEVIPYQSINGECKPQCPDGKIYNSITRNCDDPPEDPPNPPERIPPTLDRPPWYEGRPCDPSIYLFDNFGASFDPDASGDRITRGSGWTYGTYDGVTGWIFENGVGFGDIVIPETEELRGNWYFRNPDEICSSQSQCIFYNVYGLYLTLSSSINIGGIEIPLPPVIQNPSLTRYLVAVCRESAPTVQEALSILNAANPTLSGGKWARVYVTRGPECTCP